MRRTSLIVASLWLGQCLLVLSITLCLLAPSAARADETLLHVPILFHVAERDGKPVAAEDFLTRQLQHADLIYRPLGIELVAVARRKLSSRHARLITRGDRDALAALVRPGHLNVFIVGTLMDVDEPARERRGVHWHVRGNRQKHFVIVSAISGPYVLAHELGHFFGNPEHSETPGNLMSYQHTDQVPVLDERQRERVRLALAALLSSGELRRVSAKNAASSRAGHATSTLPAALP